MNKKVMIIGGVCIAAIVIGVLYFLLSKEPEKPEEPVEEVKIELQTFELKTAETYDSLPEETRYYIDSVEELNKLYYLYSDKFFDELELKDSYLRDYALFVEVRLEESDSKVLELSSVKITNNVDFVVKESGSSKSSKQAFWYLVALVPRNMINNKDISDWSTPSDVMAKMSLLTAYSFQIDSENKYTIITDMRFKTLRNDGGSYDSIYYQIDLDNNMVMKIREIYNANLGGEATLEVKTLFSRRIEESTAKKIQSIIEELKATEETEEDRDGIYTYYTLVGLDLKNDYFAPSNIKKLNSIIEMIDK